MSGKFQTVELLLSWTKLTSNLTFTNSFIVLWAPSGRFNLWYEESASLTDNHAFHKFQVFLNLSVEGGTKYTSLTHVLSFLSLFVISKRWKMPFWNNRKCSPYLYILCTLRRISFEAFCFFFCIYLCLHILAHVITFMLIQFFVSLTL